MAINVPLKLPWRWRCGLGCSYLMSPRREWEIRKLTRSPNLSVACIVTTISPSFLSNTTCAWCFIWPTALRFSIRASYWQKVRRRKSRRMKSFRPLIWGRPHERRTRSSRSSHVLWQEPHSARCQPRRRRRKHHNAARSQWRRQVDNSAKPYGAHSGARGENHHLRNRYHRDGAISDCRDGCGVCAGRPARVRELDGRRKSARPDRAERFLDDRADLRAVPAACRTENEQRPPALRR